MNYGVTIFPTGSSISPAALKIEYQLLQVILLVHEWHPVL